MGYDALPKDNYLFKYSFTMKSFYFLNLSGLTKFH